MTGNDQEKSMAVFTFIGLKYADAVYKEICILFRTAS